MRLETEKARDRFKEMGLTYADLGQAEIDLLRECISDQLKTFNNNSFKMELRSQRLQDKKFVNGKIVRCSIKVNAFYFTGREAITFNESGFIGFAGWADSINVKPFVAAFNNWLDHFAAPMEAASFESEATKDIADSGQAALINSFNNIAQL